MADVEMERGGGGCDVIVTGGASGLGAAVVERLTRLDHRPLVLDAQKPAAGVVHRIVDLADSVATHAAVDDLAREAGGLDAVVTCCGIDVPGPLDGISAAAWERVVAVNLLGTVAVVRAALPWLERSPRGRVVTVASTLGHRAVPHATAYCASKFGVVGFTRALAAELAGRVGVTLLTPGGMRTSFFDGREEQYRPGPDADLCDPDAVAAVVVSALETPAGCEIREVVVTSPRESSYP
jgi:NAD(P)-dependent dehydrogenase (short-subunit alcohol dehydrogenase family)